MNDERDRVTVSDSGFGACQVCGSYTDLRNGACIACSSRVGAEIKGKVIRLWDKEDPSVEWYVCR